MNYRYEEDEEDEGVVHHIIDTFIPQNDVVDALKDLLPDGF